MHKLIATLLCTVLLGCTPAHAEQTRVPDYISAAVPAAELVGQSRMTYLMWDVYDAAFFRSSQHENLQPPYALSLTYLRSITGRQIADSAVDEMRKHGFTQEIILAEWHNMMVDLFPDVEPGTQLTGIATADGTTQFYHDGRFIGQVNDASFTARFFDIWLGPQTSDVAFRNRLLGTGS